MPRLLLILALVVAAGSGPTDAPAAPAGDRIVNFYNWSDYIDPAVVEAFTRETGIAVKYDTFDSNDMLETKLLAGNSGYDLVVPTAYFLERQIKAGIFRKLWGTTGIGYNVGSAKAILGAQATLDSWDLVFKPEAIAKFKACGVHMLDSSDDVLSAALNYLGLDPNSNDPAQLEQAADVLAKVRPSVRKFHSSEYLNALASGEICLVLGFSGDIKQAQKRAGEAKNGVDIGYVIPKEGAQLWFDNLAIPRDARHPAEAHALIDFLLRPDIAAKNTNLIAYANGVAASRPFVDRAILQDRGIYPDAATMQHLYTITAHDQKTQRLINRLWTRIKTGI